MSNLVLVINSGSSSLKFSVFDNELNVVLEGIAESLMGEEASVSWQLNGTKSTELIAGADHVAALAFVFELLKGNRLLDDIHSVGHRVVHGGEYFSSATLIDEHALGKIRECSRLAPLHNPANILGVEAVTKLLPRVPQVAVFDTAYHQSMPSRAYLYPLPREFYREQGIRRYGFHGTSHKFVVGEAIDRLNLDPDDHGLISLHLGNGCSAAAIENGRSIDTSMGFTPLEGLVMGTRSGDIDPSIHHFLYEQCNMDSASINTLLNKKSGLLGLSELSHDMRTLREAAAEGNLQAAEAIDVFCYNLAKYIGSYAVVLKRLDGIIFTGGIGENAAPIREKVMHFLKILNVQLDPEKNAQHGKTSMGRITTDDSCPVLVIATQEEKMIARETQGIVEA